MGKNYNSDSGFCLTLPESKRTLASIVAVRSKDVMSSLARQAKADFAAMGTMQDRLHELQPMYQEYRELSPQVAQKEERAKIALAMLFAAKSPDFGSIEQACEKMDSAGTQSLSDVNDVPLWKLMREILRQVPEMQVIDLEHMLLIIGLKTNRPSVDSAIETHKETFTVRKRGREKFISLKGA
jgi:hypothetical protein